MNADYSTRIRSVFILILILASFIRLYDLGFTPPSPDWDEASLGYNAYSILKTGRDEFGQSFPLIIRSFDDYKPALYMYLTIPAIALVGLTTTAVRLPSALFGIGAVTVTYYLVRLLWKMYVSDKDFVKGEHIALLTAAFLAISPWHIQFSRVAFEANVGLTLNLLGIFFFLKGIQQSRFWYLCAICFGTTVYVYQSEKVFMPLVVLLLISVMRKQVWEKRKTIIRAMILLVMISFPLYWLTVTTPNALLRARGVSIFADQTRFLERTSKRLSYDEVQHNIVGYLFDNRRITYATAMLDAYFTHFDLNWLFVDGDIARHQPPGFGHLYLWELPIILIGLYELLVSSVDRRLKWLLIGWFLITPIPASVTTGVPHPVRTLHFLPLFQLMTAWGVFRVIHRLRTIRIVPMRVLVGGVIGGFILFETAYFFDQYFIQYNQISSEHWQYGYAEAVPYVESIKDQYDRVVVSNSPPLEQSYMFFLFFSKYDPSLYQQEGGTNSGGYAETNSFSRYVFRPIRWGEEERNGRILYVGSPKEILETTRTLKVFSYRNGKPAIIVAEK